MTAREVPTTCPACESGPVLEVATRFDPGLGMAAQSAWWQFGDGTRVIGGVAGDGKYPAPRMCRTCRRGFVYHRGLDQWIHVRSMAGAPP